MTKEKAIKKIKSYLIDYLPIEDYEEAEEIIEALEQKSCNDAISKASVFEIMGNLMSIPYDFDRPINEKDVSESMDKIRALPPVTPTKCIATVKFSKEDMQKLIDEKMKDIVVERKKGKWINKSHTSDCGIKFVASECTCCGKKTFFDCDELIYRFCPNCGAEMESAE